MDACQRDARRSLFRCCFQCSANAGFVVNNVSNAAKPTLETEKTNVGKSENLRWEFPFPALEIFFDRNPCRIFRGLVGAGCFEDVLFLGPVGDGNFEDVFSPAAFRAAEAVSVFSVVTISTPKSQIWHCHFEIWH